MRFFTTASALMAMITSALAQTADFDPVYTPKNNEKIPAGSTYEITWQAPAKYADATISIHLIGGATQNTQVPLTDIASGIPNSQESYKWSIDSALGDAAVYGLIIKLESNTEIFQYSMPFQITGGNGGEQPTETSANPEDPDVTVTTEVGTMTVTLTSCPPEETTAEVPTTFITTHAWNTTVVQPTVNPPTVVEPVPTQPAPVPEPSVPTVPGVPTVPSVPQVPTTPVPTPTGVPTPVPTAGAARYVAGPVAIVGGIAMALFAF
ncbi:hypothetical protein N3K66_007393 [Trichothecium roseum]|uniref:Uncharacterized protein n=1 Tax=Trichothecium roseum TaxID=47278 RepID=A0ACC0UVK5_9HYPO|nr:hypothetical protein N3K66_007393 [Trichothecium roseum]